MNKPNKDEITVNGALDPSMIVENSFNARKEYDEKSLREMALSILSHGVIQPAIVRPLKKNVYELVAGSRRLRGLILARKILKKKELPQVTDEELQRMERNIMTLPVRIRAYDDVQAIEVGLIENIEREDLNCLEEAQAFEELLKLEKEGQPIWTIESIAAKVGKDKRYVKERLSLLTLIPEVKKLLREGKIQLGHGLLLAKLDETQQKEIADPQHYGLEALYDGSAGFMLTVDELRDRIKSLFELNLNKAPFDLNEEDLVKGVCACTICPKRTGAEPELFEGLVKGDMCKDRECFAKKVKAHMSRKLKESKENGEPLVRVSENYSGGNDKVLYSTEWHEPTTKTEKKKAIKAIVVDGPKEGKIIHIVTKKKIDDEGIPVVKQSSKSDDSDNSRQTQYGDKERVVVDFETVQCKILSELCITNIPSKMTLKTMRYIASALSNLDSKEALSASETEVMNALIESAVDMNNFDIKWLESFAKTSGININIAVHKPLKRLKALIKTESIVKAMKKAKNADAGREVISKYEKRMDELARFAEVADWSNFGAMEGTERHAEVNRRVKEAIENNILAGIELKWMVADARNAKPIWEKLLQKEHKEMLK